MSAGSPSGFPGPLVLGTPDDDRITRQEGGVTRALDGDDLVRGSNERDQILGGNGDDELRGRSDSDRLQGGNGDDNLRGGSEDDVLIGGSDDDQLRGGEGADQFLFDPTNPNEGHDVIHDLDIAAGDRIVLNAADVLRSTLKLPDAADGGDPVAIEAEDLDENSQWAIVESEDGFVEVLHPTGSITIAGLPFDPGLTFADLLPAIVLTNAQVGGRGGDVLDGSKQDDFLSGGNGNDALLGRNGDDVQLGGLGEDLLRGGAHDDILDGGNQDDRINGGRGEDIIIGGRGDDHLRGGQDADRFVFDPSRTREGHDVIVDLDIAGGDRIVLNAADVVRSTPGIASASPFGDPSVVEAVDLDQDPLWDIVESANGFVEVLHPNGSIEIAGLAFDPALTFADLLPAIIIDNAQVGGNGRDVLEGGQDDDFLAGGNGGDRLLGRDGDDVQLGGRGEDLLRGGDHDDVLDGGNQDDRVNGGRGEDIVEGGRGDDILRGGEDADRFVFDPSRMREGDDVVKDFTVGEDLLALAVADIVSATPELLEALSMGDTSDIASAAALLTALDNSSEWGISGAPGSNNLVVTHPGGTIEFEGIGFAGQTFVALAGIFDADALGLQNGDGGDNELIGTRGADLLNGEDGLDRLVGGSDDDVLVGGGDADLFAFVPVNGNEGHDIIADFNPAEGDKIELAAADVVASLEPGLLADGFQFTDLDASAGWNFQAIAGGDAIITHPGGSIALAGLGDALQGVTSFVDFTDDPSGLGLDALAIV